MKTISFFLVIQFMAITYTFAQCNSKTVHRDDGVTMEYFSPKPVIRTSEYEVGASIYKNRTTNDLLISVSVLFKTIKPQNLTGDLIIHTTSDSGIRLKPVITDLIKMHGRDVALGLFLITQRDYEILKSSKLKGLYFRLEGNLKGDSVTENKDLFNKQLQCPNFKYGK